MRGSFRTLLLYPCPTTACFKVERCLAIFEARISSFSVDDGMNNMCVCVSRSVLSDSCDPVDSSPPGSSVHGILQARVLGWVATPSLGDLPDPAIEPRSPTLQADSLRSEPPGNFSE